MKILVLTMAAAGLAVMAGAAQAGLQICNGTSDKQGVSIGYSDGGQWISEGWWNITPGNCTNVVRGDLKQRYYYVRAEVNGGGFNGTGHWFCTTPSEYTIYGDTDCIERGYDREDFYEIDTGAKAKEYTFTLY